jgi:hypothetical protein
MSQRERAPGESDDPHPAWSSRGSRPTKASVQCLMINQMSRRKNKITAASVPNWVIAVKADPGSSPPKNCPTMD